MIFSIGSTARARGNLFSVQTSKFSVQTSKTLYLEICLTVVGRRMK